MIKAGNIQMKTYLIEAEALGGEGRGVGVGVGGAVKARA